MNNNLGHLIRMTCIHFHWNCVQSYSRLYIWWYSIPFWYSYDNTKAADRQTISMKRKRTQQTQSVSLMISNGTCLSTATTTTMTTTTTATTVSSSLDKPWGQDQHTHTQNRVGYTIAMRARDLERPAGRWWQNEWCMGGRQTGQDWKRNGKMTFIYLSGNIIRFSYAIKMHLPPCRPNKCKTQLHCMHTTNLVNMRNGWQK